MLLWRGLGGIIKKPAPALPGFISQGIPEAQLRSYADKATPVVNKILSHAKSALDGTAPGFSLGLAFVLGTFGRIAAVVPILVMAYVPLLAAFTLPKVYELYKDQIDSGITAGREQATKLYEKLQPILSKIPRAQAAAPAASSTMKKAE